MQTRVAIVVTTDGSADLAGLVLTHDVWIADTPANRVAAKANWSARKGDEPHGVTTFKVDDTDTPYEWVATILMMVDIHHDLRAEIWSSDITLDVHGVGPTPPILSALAEYGPFEIIEWSGGFSATRRKST